MPCRDMVQVVLFQYMCPHLSQCVLTCHNVYVGHLVAVLEHLSSYICVAYIKMNNLKPLHLEGQDSLNGHMIRGKVLVWGSACGHDSVPWDHRVHAHVVEAG